MIIIATCFKEKALLGLHCGLPHGSKLSPFTHFSTVCHRACSRQLTK